MLPSPRESMRPRESGCLSRWGRIRPLHVLRLRDFALFLGGRFFAVLVAQMQWVAICWYLYELTGDPMTLGCAGLAAFLPIALLTLPAGDLSDPVDRRWLLGAAPLLLSGAS